MKEPIKSPSPLSGCALSHEILLQGLVFHQCCNYIRITGSYNVSRAQVRFIMLVSGHDTFTVSILIGRYGFVERNAYAYFKTLVSLGLLYRPARGVYSLTDKGRELVAVFGREYHKRVLNFRW